MSTSTDAVLFWGLCFTSEEILPWHPGGAACEPLDIEDDREDDRDYSDDDEEDLDDAHEEDPDDPDYRYAAACGLKPPEERYSKAPKKWKTYFDERQKLIEEAPVGLGHHCSAEVTMYYVYIKTSETTANRGFPQVIEPGKRLVEKTWPTLIRDYCEKMGIPVTQEPRWWMLSYWS